MTAALQEPAADAIQAELTRITTSSKFAHSRQLSIFLRYAVEQKLAGRESQLKETVIGAEVFDRGASYDPRVDPIVRVIAGRLRKRLQEYYETEGQNDSVRIELPKGTYVPVFSFVSQSEISPHWSGTLDHSLKRHPSRRMQIAVRLSVLTALIAVISLVPIKRWMRSNQLPVVVPLTAYRGSEYYPNFSPDGKQVAFSWSKEGESNFAIYTKAIGEDQPRRQLTTGSFSDLGPAWSPNGQLIAFVRVAELSAQLIVIPAQGGTERKLIDVRNPFPYMIGDPGPLVAWSPDGAQLVFADQGPRSQALALFAMRLDDGRKRQLPFPANSLRGDSDPSFSPDGSQIAFVRTKDVSAGEVYAMPITADLTVLDQPRKITSLHRYTRSPAWSPDGQSIIFSSGLWAHVALWTCPVKRCDAPQRLPGFGDDGYEPVVHAKTGRLAFARFVEDYDIWKIPLSHHRQSSAVNLIASTRRDMDAALSPDGLAIVFVSERSGDMNLWICRADGSNPRQLTDFHGAPSGSPQWSPDGKTIVFDNPAAGQLDIYITNPEGTYVKRITQDFSGGLLPSWSRDGKWIYFCSQRSGRMEIWKTQLATGITNQVTANGGYKVRESVDGRFLYYTKSDSKQASLWKRAVEGGSEAVIIDSIWTRRFEPTGDGIYFQPGSTVPEADEIAFLNFSSGTVRKVAVVPRVRGSLFAVTPDNGALLLSRAGGEVADLMLVDKVH